LQQLEIYHIYLISEDREGDHGESFRQKGLQIGDYFLQQRRTKITFLDQIDRVWPPKSQATQQRDYESAESGMMKPAKAQT